MDKSDVMDSRDLEERLTELVDAGPGQDADDIRERKALKELKAETEGMGWQYGIAFISDDYFEDYARELAEDIGAIPKNSTWPVYCIDWEWAARELRMDYSAVDIDGVTYWYLEA